MAGDPASVITAVVSALDRLGIPYYLGGSIASGTHGVYRATSDVNIVADLREEHVDALARMLGTTFYADAGMMRDAVRHCSNFNLLDLATGFKVDVFIPKVYQSPADKNLLAASLSRRVAPGSTTGHRMPTFTPWASCAACSRRA